MNFFRKKYERIDVDYIEPEQDINIPEPSENLFVFKDSENIMILFNDVEKEVFEYSQFNSRTNILQELLTVKKQ